jgi:DNA-binding transcriptional MerR regulator
MFTIGDFAKHGRVTVRMLRHYDAIGLLRPAHVDPVSSYRYYRAEQLTQLNRIVALKDLGFGLDQVRSILHDSVSAGELRGMLRLRRAELEAVLADAAARLAMVEARLRTIESEHLMPVDDIVVKSLPALRVAELTGISTSFDPGEIGPVVSGLRDALRRRLRAAGVATVGPGVTRYEDVHGNGAIVVHAGLPVAAEIDETEINQNGTGVTGIGDVEEMRIVDLAAVERAATILHCGSPDDVLPTVQVLARWLAAHDCRLTAQHSRELALGCPDDRSRWVTELQVPMAAAG